MFGLNGDGRQYTRIMTGERRAPQRQDSIKNHEQEITERTEMNFKRNRVHYLTLILIPDGPRVSCVPDSVDDNAITTPLALIIVSSPAPPATAKVA